MANITSEPQNLNPQEERKLLLTMLQQYPGGSLSNLSAEQNRVWLLHQLDPSAPLINSFAASVSGEFDVAALNQYAREVMERHEVLRSTFVTLGPSPVRLVAPVAFTGARVVDAEGYPQGMYHDLVWRCLEEDAIAPFDLRSGPLLRMTLVRWQANLHALLLTTHQIVSDVFSPALFVTELLRRYEERGVVGGQEGAEDAVKFGSLMEKERRWLDGVEYEDCLRYWRQFLEDVPVLELPVDRPRPTVRRQRGAEVRCEIGPGSLTLLREVSRAENIPLTRLFLAAFKILLSWYSGQDDIVVGVITSARDESSREVIGPLANAVVVRSDLGGDPHFLELLRRVSRVSEACERQAAPFSSLVKDLQPPRDLSRTPLFQAAFVTREDPFRGLTLSSLSVSALDVHPGIATYDLTLGVQLGDSATLSLEYNSDIFCAESVQQMLGSLRRILEAVAQRPDKRLSHLMVLEESKRRQFVSGWNSTSEAFREETCVHQLFEEQAARTPNAVALSANQEHVTYGELARRADCVASFLRSRGVGPETRVGICLEHPPDMVVAILAVLKAGGAYVPLEPKSPSTRLEFILQDSGASLLLTSRTLAPVLPRFTGIVTLEDGLNAQIDDDDGPVGAPRCENLAYIIYTSGSTGRPKGVAVQHQSIVNNLLARQRMWGMTPADRVLQSYSFTFDPSAWATFWPLSAGACIVFPLLDGALDSVALARLMAQQRITVYGAAPSLHSILADEPVFRDCDSLRYIFSGGESLDGQLQSLLHHHLRADVYNVYGPTEATIDCTSWLCPRVNEPGPMPIGRPIANTRIYVVNRHLEINPEGTPGEICIGGIGLARGYVNDPALTAEKFIPDPFSTTPGARMYRTGDIGRGLSGGVFEFIGRADDQVKVRGFRIELAEIERNVICHEAVREAAVVVRRASPADTRIIAYIAPDESAGGAAPTELAEFLGGRLPKYMIPDIFVSLPTLPRTANGKINRNALPAAEETLKNAQRGGRPPRDILESEIAKMIEGVLGLEQMGIDEDIFELGCNSLLIARIASRLSNAYHIDLPVQHIFKDPTVAGIAALVGAYQREGVAGVTTSYTLGQMEAEAELDPLITAEGLPPFAPQAPKFVFLTGVTGYLGAFILERLLRQTSAEFLCLVRARDVAQGLDRIRRTMTEYRIWDESFSMRIHPVVGDLAKRNLGIPQEEFSQIARKADIIYHCGALVNFVYPYSALRGPNVVGTHEVLRLAATAKLKPVHFISTVDVLLATHMQRPFIENDDVLFNPKEIPDGYARSKWVAEKMLWTARSRGIPVTVYRPGLIMGHTQTGATQTNDYLLVGLKGYIDLGVLAEPGIMIDFVTVDFVAEAIAYLSQRPESHGRYFHIWNPRPVHMSRAYDWIHSFGYRLKVVPGKVLREKVLKEVDLSSVLYPFLPIFRAMREDPPISSHDPRIVEKINLLDECKNTFEALEEMEIKCPPLDERLAHLCLSYLVSIGFLPEPALTGATA